MNLLEQVRGDFHPGQVGQIGGLDAAGVGDLQPARLDQRGGGQRLGGQWSADSGGEVPHTVGLVGYQRGRVAQPNLAGGVELPGFGRVGLTRGVVDPQDIQSRQHPAQPAPGLRCGVPPHQNGHAQSA